MDRRFLPLKKQKEYQTDVKYEPERRDGWVVSKIANSIRELNDYVAKLREMGNQVETLTVRTITNKPYRVVRYIVWKNPLTGIYLAETRIEEPTKRLIGIQGGSNVNTNLLTKP